MKHSFYPLAAIFLFMLAYGAGFLPGSGQAAHLAPPEDPQNNSRYVRLTYTAADQGIPLGVGARHPLYIDISKKYGSPSCTQTECLWDYRDPNTNSLTQIAMTTDFINGGHSASMSHTNLNAVQSTALHRLLTPYKLHATIGGKPAVISTRRAY